MWRVGGCRYLVMTVCQAVHGAAACRCTAEPTPSPPMRSGRWNSGEVTSLSKLRASDSGTNVVRKACCMRRDQKVITCLSKFLSLLFRHKAHAEDVLTGSTHVHGD